MDDVRVRGVGTAMKYSKVAIPEATALPLPVVTTPVFFDRARVLTPAYKSADLTYGHIIHGPAVVLDTIGTIVVEPGCALRVTQHGDYVIDVGGTPQMISSPSIDAILASNGIGKSEPQSPKPLGFSDVSITVDAVSDASVPSLLDGFAVSSPESAVMPRSGSAVGGASTGSAFQRPRKSSAAADDHISGIASVSGQLSPQLTTSSHTNTPPKRVAVRSLSTALDPIQLSIFSHRHVVLMH